MATIPRRPGCRSCAATPPAPATAPRAASGASGFSLIELLLAVVLLGVGVLALATTASGVVRMTVLGGRLGGSAVVAASRFDMLRATVCALPAGEAETVSGSAADGRFRERWSVALSGPARAAQMVVTYADGPQQRSDVYETVIACPQ
jgi:prepilin-type N-terminal cleavage/methylation domain-containing protein